MEVPQSPEALEYAHFCLRNAYHALLGATAKNVTIQPQVNTANINFDWHWLATSSVSILWFCCEKREK